MNLVQLTVKLVAFLVALPFAFHAIGGYDGLVAATDGGSYWSPWRGGASGWIYLAMLGPSFFLSPGILQKVYGARDDRAVRIGVLANAAALFVFAFMPVLLGMIARGLHPGLPNIDLALPTLLVHDVPLVRRQPRPGRPGLRRDQRGRRGAVHARDVAVAGSLQALRQPAGDRRAGAAASRAARRSAAASPASSSRCCRRPSATR